MLNRIKGVCYKKDNQANLIGVYEVTCISSYFSFLLFSEQQVAKENVKTEPDTDNITDTDTCPEPSPLPLYDTTTDIAGSIGDLTNPIFASYRHMLSLGNDDRSFSPLIPTTVQEQQQVPSPTGRESRVSSICEYVYGW